MIEKVKQWLSEPIIVDKGLGTERKTTKGEYLSDEAISLIELTAFASGMVYLYSEAKEIITKALDGYADVERSRYERECLQSDKEDIDH